MPGVLFLYTPFPVSFSIALVALLRYGISRWRTAAGFLTAMAGVDRSLCCLAGCRQGQAKKKESEKISKPSLHRNSRENLHRPPYRGILYGRPKTAFITAARSWIACSPFPTNVEPCMVARVFG